MPRVEFGQFKSDKFDMKFNYELWIPEGLQVIGCNFKKHLGKMEIPYITFSLASKC